MATYDDLMSATVVLGRPGLAGAAVPTGQITEIETRLTAVEDAQVDSLGDLSDVDLTGIAPGDTLVWDGAKLVKQTPETTRITAGLSYMIDGGGAAITTGLKYGFQVPHEFAITRWELAADVSTTSTVNVWIDADANYPPTSADIKITMSLSGSAKNAVDVVAISYPARSWVFFEVSANSAATVLLPNLTITRAI